MQVVWLQSHFSPLGVLPPSHCEVSVLPIWLRPTSSPGEVVQTHTEGLGCRESSDGVEQVQGLTARGQPCTGGRLGQKPCVFPAACPLCRQSDLGRHRAWRPRPGPGPPKGIGFPLGSPGSSSISEYMAPSRLRAESIRSRTNGNSDILSSNAGFH